MLLKKMVDFDKPFLLTLVGLSVSDLIETGRGKLENFFGKKMKAKKADVRDRLEGVEASGEDNFCRDSQACLVGSSGGSSVSSAGGSSGSSGGSSGSSGGSSGSSEQEKKSTGEERYGQKGFFATYMESMKRKAEGRAGEGRNKEDEEEDEEEEEERGNKRKRVDGWEESGQSRCEVKGESQVPNNTFFCSFGSFFIFNDRNFVLSLATNYMQFQRSVVTVVGKELRPPPTDHPAPPAASTALPTLTPRSGPAFRRTSGKSWQAKGKFKTLGASHPKKI